MNYLSKKVYNDCFPEIHEYVSRPKRAGLTFHFRSILTLSPSTFEKLEQVALSVVVQGSLPLRRRDHFTAPSLPLYRMRWLIYIYRERDISLFMVYGLCADPSRTNAEPTDTRKLNPDPIALGCVGRVRMSTTGFGFTS